MNIADLFKEKLKNQSVEAPADLWSRIEDNMNISESLFNNEMLQKAAQSKNSASIFSKATTWKISSIAAVVTIAVATTVFFITSENSEQPITTPSLIVEPVAQNEKPQSDSTLPKTENPVTVEKAEVFPSPQELKSILPTISEKESATSQNNENQNKNNIGNEFKETLLGTTPVTQNQEKQTIPQEEKTPQTIPSIKEEKTIDGTDKIVNNLPANNKVTTTPAEPTIKIQAANFITPNGDGHNDFWVVTNLDKLTSYTLQILDKRGRRVFETSNYLNDWNGDNLAIGTYYYMLRYLYNGKENYQRGVIEIIRN